MALKQVIDDALRHIHSGVLKSEAQVRQVVIEPILQELGWKFSNPEEVLSEYDVDTGKVDLALFANKKPQVFVEAKRLGNLSAKAEEQLFRYAVNKGIPLLVLTDGSIWDFYLSMAAGEPANRRFCRIELDAQDGSLLRQHEESFQKFLGKEQVASERARRDAEKLHEDTKRRAQAKAAIPGAWEFLLNPPNELLIELLAEEVEGMCGIRPRDEDVVSFFNQPGQSLASRVSPPKERSNAATTQSPKPGKTTQDQESATPPGKIVGFRLNANEFPCSNANATLVSVLKELHAQDPKFLSRLYSDPRNRTKKRVLVSQDRGELYTKPFPDYMSKSLGGGWWVGTNLNVVMIVQKIKLACDVAGVKFGKDLTLLEK